MGNKAGLCHPCGPCSPGWEEEQRAREKTLIDKRKMRLDSATIDEGQSIDNYGFNEWDQARPPSPTFSKTYTFNPSKKREGSPSYTQTYTRTFANSMSQTDHNKRNREASHPTARLTPHDELFEEAEEAAFNRRTREKALSTPVKYPNRLPAKPEMARESLPEVQIRPFSPSNSASPATNRPSHSHEPEVEVRPFASSLASTSDDARPSTASNSREPTVSIVSRPSTTSTIASTTRNSSTTHPSPDDLHAGARNSDLQPSTSKNGSPTDALRFGAAGEHSSSPSRRNKKRSSGRSKRPPHGPTAPNGAPWPNRPPPLKERVQYPGGYSDPDSFPAPPLPPKLDSRDSQAKGGLKFLTTALEISVKGPWVYEGIYRRLGGRVNGQPSFRHKEREMELRWREGHWRLEDPTATISLLYDQQNKVWLDLEFKPKTSLEIFPLSSQPQVSKQQSRPDSKRQLKPSSRQHSKLEPNRSDEALDLLSQLINAPMTTFQPVKTSSFGLKGGHNEASF